MININSLKLINLPDKNININYLPKEGDIVNSKLYGNVTLLSKLSQGGEGIIFKCSLRDKVCKIYYKDKLTRLKYEKVKLLANNKFNIEGVCFPEDILYFKNNFVGYIMEKAEGTPLQRCIFIKRLLNQKFPYWKREHLVNLSLSILNKIRSLHSKNIIIGDINPLNILVKNETKVYFVDVDSYQVISNLGIIPCPVGTEHFTPPRLQGKDFKNNIRTFEDEYFAVAVLIFMILFPGKHPYSHQGGGSPGENIKKMNFPYPFNGEKSKNPPIGAWRFIWSHLPYKLKEAFYEVFANNNRIPPKKWEKLLKFYLFNLKSEISNNELFPHGFKIRNGYSYQTFCEMCGKNFEIDIEFYNILKKQDKKVYCPECNTKIQLKIIEKKSKKKPKNKKSKYYSTYNKSNSNSNSVLQSHNLFSLVISFLKKIGN